MAANVKESSFQRKGLAMASKPRSQVKSQKMLYSTFYILIKALLSNLLQQSELPNSPTWSNSHNSDSNIRQISGDWKCHAHDGSFAGRISSLSPLTIKSCNTGSVDNDTTLTIGIWLIGRHQLTGKANDVEGPTSVNLKDRAENACMSTRNFL